jgi:hypothetical protein
MAEITSMDATREALLGMVVGDALGQIAAGWQLAVLVLMVGSATWAAVRPGRLPIVAFVLCALMWSRADQAFEGAVLWSFSSEHGLTVADLWPPILGQVVLLARHGRGLLDAGSSPYVRTILSCCSARPSPLRATVILNERY